MLFRFLLMEPALKIRLKARVVKKDPSFRTLFFFCFQPVVSFGVLTSEASTLQR